MSTSIVGDLDEILDVGSCCHRAVADRGDSRVITTITLDEHRGASQSLDEAIRSVQGRLASAFTRETLTTQGNKGPTWARREESPLPTNGALLGVPVA